MLSADLARVNIARRLVAESDGQWRKRYGLRAGIEGTNSELKRRHGLGPLTGTRRREGPARGLPQGPGMQRQADDRGTTDRDGRDVGPVGCPGHCSRHCMKPAGAVANPVIPDRTALVAPQRPHRPQHKPQPEFPTHTPNRPHSLSTNPKDLCYEAQLLLLFADQA